MTTIRARARTSEQLAGSPPTRRPGVGQVRVGHGYPQRVDRVPALAWRAASGGPAAGACGAAAGRPARGPGPADWQAAAAARRRPRAQAYVLAVTIRAAPAPLPSSRRSQSRSESQSVAPSGPFAAGTLHRGRRPPARFIAARRTDSARRRRPGIPPPPCPARVFRALRNAARRAGNGPPCRERPAVPGTVRQARRAGSELVAAAQPQVLRPVVPRAPAAAAASRRLGRRAPA